MQKNKKTKYAIIKHNMLEKNILVDSKICLLSWIIWILMGLHMAKFLLPIHVLPNADSCSWLMKPLLCGLLTQTLAHCCIRGQQHIASWKSARCKNWPHSLWCWLIRKRQKWGFHSFPSRFKGTVYSCLLNFYLWCMRKIWNTDVKQNSISASMPHKVRPLWTFGVYWHSSEVSPRWSTLAQTEPLACSIDSLWFLCFITGATTSVGWGGGHQTTTVALIRRQGVTVEVIAKVINSMVMT